MPANASRKAPAPRLEISIIGVTIRRRISSHCRIVAATLNAAQTARYPSARKYGRPPSPPSTIIGAADGSIMPVIITAHIAHSRNRCGASQTGVIIQALAPVIGPYMSLARTTIQAQETTGTRTSIASTGQDRVRIGCRIVVRPAAASGIMPTWRSDGIQGQRRRAHRVQLRLGLPVQLQRTAQQGALRGR